MTGLVRSEVRKITSTITIWVMTAIGIGLAVIGTLLSLLMPQGAGMGEFTGTDSQVAGFVDQVGGASIIVLVVALLAMTTEFRHGTIGRTLQITPSRTQVVLGKLIATTIYAVVFLVVGLVVVGLIVVIGAATRGVSLEVGQDTGMAVWYGLVGLSLTAWFGVALGALLRSQVVALTLSLIWMFVVEQAFIGLAPDIGRWLPFNALNAVFIPAEMGEAMGDAGLPYLDPLMGLTVFLGYVVVAGTAAVVLMRTRDV